MINLWRTGELFYMSYYKTLLHGQCRYVCRNRTFLRINIVQYLFIYAFIYTLSHMLKKEWYLFEVCWNILYKGGVVKTLAMWPHLSFRNILGHKHKFFLSFFFHLLVWSHLFIKWVLFVHPPAFEVWFCPLKGATGWMLVLAWAYLKNSLSVYCIC